MELSYLVLSGFSPCRPCRWAYYVVLSKLPKRYKKRRRSVMSLAFEPMVQSFLGIYDDVCIQHIATSLQQSFPLNHSKKKKRSAFCDWIYAYSYRWLLLLLLSWLLLLLLLLTCQIETSVCLLALESSNSLAELGEVIFAPEAGSTKKRQTSQSHVRLFSLNKNS